MFFVVYGKLKISSSKNNFKRRNRYWIFKICE